MINKKGLVIGLTPPSPCKSGFISTLIGIGGCSCRSPASESSIDISIAVVVYSIRPHNGSLTKVSIEVKVAKDDVF
jgi:hypothetical protein